MTDEVTRPTVLWWGRSDPAYSRNAVIRGAFEALGWRVVDYRPHASALGALEAGLRPPPPSDLLWVPCFRQRDLAAARRYATRHGLALIADPLISAFDKQVGERGKHAPDSRAALRLKAWEAERLEGADRVVVDTTAHRAYFAETFKLQEASLFVVPVGAEEDVFEAAPAPVPGSPPEALFFGSFLPLQGAAVIVEAARRLRDEDITVTLLGDGPERARCESLAQGVPALRFEPWVDYASLPARISRAQLLLGVFGDTDKAGRVIPNKVYQALASARPVMTRCSVAYPQALRDAPRPGLRLLPAGEPQRLAHDIDAYFAAPKAMAGDCADARAIYDEWFSAARVRSALASLLASLDLPARAAKAQ